MPGKRSVEIGGDAHGNVLITGDGNVVVISPTQTLEPEEPRPTPIGPNPYVGLSAFQEKDADRFFGREKLTAELWEKLRALHETKPGTPPPPRLLPIYGPSGSGKSSLARAGLIPELARRPLPALAAPRVAVITPGAHPLEALAGILARIATNDPTPVAKTREFAEELRRASNDGQHDGLRRIADALPEIATSRLIVFIDQFEEVYSLCKDAGERDAFVANLLHAAADPAARASVILTLRSDFLGETQRHAALNRAIAEQGVLVPGMSEAELRAAISEPAAAAGHPLDAGIVDLLVAETEGREGALPLLQFALTRIWEGMAEGKEPAETLREIGGVGGALAGEAQRFYDELGEADQQVVRRAFLALIHLGEGVRDTRRHAVLEEIVAHGEDAVHVEEVVRLFARPGARLITLSAAPGAHTYPPLLS